MAEYEMLPDPDKPDEGDETVDELLKEFRRDEIEVGPDAKAKARDALLKHMEKPENQ